jgi:hypothetical protein
VPTSHIPSVFSGNSYTLLICCSLCLLTSHVPAFASSSSNLEQCHFLGKPHHLCHSRLDQCAETLFFCCLPHQTVGATRAGRTHLLHPNMQDAQHILKVKHLRGNKQYPWSTLQDAKGLQ